MTVLGLADHTYNFNGLTFGLGTSIMVDHAEGFEGFDVRQSDSDQPRNDGAIRGLDYVAPRTVAFTLSLGETSDTSYEADWATLRAAINPSRSIDQALTFKRPGQIERYINCRPVQLVRVQEYLSFDQVGHPPLVLRAADPRIYSTTSQSVNLPIYAASAGGMDWSVTDWPIDYTGGFQSLIPMVNNGSADAFPLIRVYGPLTGTCTGFTLTNITNGAVLAVSTSISTGSILTADMTAAVTGANSLVISLDGSSRYGSWTVPRSAFNLSPGSNSLKFQITGTSTDVVCNLTWADTWLD